MSSFMIPAQQDKEHWFNPVTFELSTHEKDICIILLDERMKQLFTFYQEYQKDFDDGKLAGWYGDCEVLAYKICNVVTELFNLSIIRKSLMFEKIVLGDQCILDLIELIFNEEEYNIDFNNYYRACDGKEVDEAERHFEYIDSLRKLRYRLYDARGLIVTQESENIYINGCPIQDFYSLDESKKSVIAEFQEQINLEYKAFELEKQRQRFYGFTLEEWNSMTEDAQIAIQDRAEYRAQHADQAEWGLKD